MLPTVELETGGLEDLGLFAKISPQLDGKVTDLPSVGLGEVTGKAEMLNARTEESNAMTINIATIFTLILIFRLPIGFAVP